MHDADTGCKAFGWRARVVLPAREAYALWAETYPPWPHNP